MKNLIDYGAAICSGIFITMLALSAYWDPSIRILHTFESLPYFGALILCIRHHKYGYALGIVSGAFWIWTGGFLTTFIHNGFERLLMLIRTGTVDRPDILIAAPAGIALAGLVLLSLVGYVRYAHKSRNDVFLFLITMVIVPAFFIAIFAAFAPQFLGMFHGILSK